jgi:AAHS family 4-hydroxybenzoate transporter-like MFS transporter
MSIPVFGWQSLFVIGGLFSLVMAGVLFFWLPESPHFLALKRPDSPHLRALAQKLLPGEDIPATARFTTLDPQDQANEAAGTTFRNLFTGARATATSLLWALFFFDAVGFFFLASWLPVVMEGAGVSHGTASLTASLFTFTGMLGGFLVMRFLDRIGPMAMLALPILGGPAEILIGAGLPEAAMLTFVGLAGMCLGGIHYAVYAIAVRYYPPTLRGRGVSAATVWGRAGGIVAPYIGGYFLSAHMPIQRLMIIAAIPCIATAIVGFALGRVYRHFDRAAGAPLGKESAA